MPLGDPAFYGTNGDDSRNEDYCIYCYAGGEFTEEDMTMEQMIELCADMIEASGAAAGTSREESIAKMKEYFPKLKRWAAKSTAEE